MIYFAFFIKIFRKLYSLLFLSVDEPRVGVKAEKHKARTRRAKSCKCKTRKADECKCERCAKQGASTQLGFCLDHSLAVGRRHSKGCW